MSVRSFRCRWFGDLTDGVDEWVLCLRCFQELERLGVVVLDPWDHLMHAPITPDVEARLRKLLDE
jgi:hypothetical protein